MKEAKRLFLKRKHCQKTQLINIQLPHY